VNASGRTVHEAGLAARSKEEGGKVSALRIVAIVLIAAGIIGLVYGGITYTKSSHDTKIGPLEFSIKDKETVNIPVWAGVGAIVAGGILFFLRSGK
jgi:TRAP-type C4-dicarboxylate transport system permease small subunit